MQIKIELSVDEVEEALKRYVAHKVSIDGYRPGDVDFVYDGGDPDYGDHTPIEGAFVTLTLSNPQIHVLPARAESLAPEGWRSV